MLRTRVLTALVLAALLLTVLFYLPPDAGVGFIAAVTLLGAWEWARFAGLEGPTGRLTYVLICAILCALAWDYTHDARRWHALMVGAALWWVLAFAWLALRPHAGNRLAAALAGPVVLVPAWVGLGRLIHNSAPGVGAGLLLYLLLLVFAADIGAYFAGRSFGRLPLAPDISPKKTWEGALGGLAAGSACAWVGAGWFYRMPQLPLVALGGAVVLASMVGDLTESMFKRHSGLKDSGGLLPGHGGVLDRIDSITAAVPFYVLGLGWLGVLS
jgi:phosphatidate cytidylyltransferase